MSKMWWRYCWSSIQNSKIIRGTLIRVGKMRTIQDNHVTQIYQRTESVRLFSSLPNTDTRQLFVPFDVFINEKRNQAKNSILIQVNSEKSVSELHSYCSQYGNILGIHHYTVNNSTVQHFMLVEFSNEKEVSSLLSSANFTEDPEMIPVQSPFLWFRSENKNKAKISEIMGNTQTVSDYNLVIKNGCFVPHENYIIKTLLKLNSISEQIQSLYNITHLNDLGVRLRYIAARQIENCLVGMYPNIVVHPFGSTVNGFGKLGCDLDLVLKFTVKNIKNTLDSRLIFHTKKSTMSCRLQQQRYSEIISDLIYHFAPGCSHIRKILQARIPIIKYNQDFTGLECDLSINSLSGLYMSELLYIYGSLDSRIRPLVFTIRKWAQYVGLTNSSPGKWITNFPLTLMVLFFLQNAPDGPLLPSFNYLKKHAGENDFRMTDDYVDCTFIRDIKNIDFHSNNNANLETLLYQFFEFYSTFEFSSNAISLNEGKPVKKSDYAPLYIINPLEKKLNVSKNVSYEEITRMKIEFKNAAWFLNTCNSNDNQDKSMWGLPVLLRNDHNNLNKKIADITRLVRVKDLFSNESHVEMQITEKSVFDNDEKLTKKSEETLNNIPKDPFYKNDSMENVVNNIRKQTVKAIRHLELIDPDDGKNRYNSNGRRIRRR